MKTTIKAAFMIAGSFGNLIVVIAAKIKLMEQVCLINIQTFLCCNSSSLFLNIFFTQANEFFFFGSIMILDMILLALIAYKYKSIKPKSEEIEVS